jgi:ribosome biogenesis GTPase A
MVVGMPNVGKSSFINALKWLNLKGGKPAPTGALPGVTRSVSFFIKVIPAVQVIIIIIIISIDID